MPSLEQVEIDTLEEGEAEINQFRCHDLRECAITNLFLNGWSIAEVSVVSGHKTWSELQRYTRIKASDLIVKINNKGKA